MDREPVNIPLQTGIKVIDALIPIGRGQRELILGDRQTGKTAIALDTIVNQKDQDVVCITASSASAQPRSQARLTGSGQAARGSIAPSWLSLKRSDPPGLEYVAPYAATTIGEFHDAGSRCADHLRRSHSTVRAYRELSLLLRWPPGREAFPGDIFYIHSRLLERATRLRAELGGRSLTALPMSKPRRRTSPTTSRPTSFPLPTVRFTSRRGCSSLACCLRLTWGSPFRALGAGAASCLSQPCRLAKLAYSQFEEMEIFARFGTRLDENARKIIEHGRRIRACLKQPQFAPVPVSEQIVVLLALTAGLFDEVPLDQTPEAEHAVRQTAVQLPETVLRKLFQPGSGSVPKNAKSFSGRRARPWPLSVQRHE